MIVELSLLREVRERNPNTVRMETIPLTTFNGRQVMFRYMLSEVDARCSVESATCVCGWTCKV